MSQNKWKITLKIHRQKEAEAPHFDEFALDVDPDEQKTADK